MRPDFSRNEGCCFAAVSDVHPWQRSPHELRTLLMPLVFIVSRMPLASAAMQQKLGVRLLPTTGSRVLVLGGATEQDEST